MKARVLTTGEPAPWFKARTTGNEAYSFDTVGGRFVVLCFFGTAGSGPGQALLAALAEDRHRFDDTNLAFFGVSGDPQDEGRPGVANAIPGIRYFWDDSRDVAALYGAVGDDGQVRPLTYVLDPMLRVLAAIPLTEDVAGHLALLRTLLDRLPKIGPPVVITGSAPVLVVPRLFEPGLCQTLMNYYESRGGQDSGFMRDVDGKTVGIIGYHHKRRRDCLIEDDALRQACAARIQTRLAPEIRKAFNFDPTRMERYIVSCYDGEEKGHFRAHRDNTTKGTAHRRFAVSLFLNSGSYEGGLLRFPEFGPALYTAPPGGAVVFSCSLLHEALPVTAGRRYMFLPFLYDESAKKVRQANQAFLSEPNEAVPVPQGDR